MDAMVDVVVEVPRGSRSKYEVDARGTVAESRIRLDGGVTPGPAR